MEIEWMFFCVAFALYLTLTVATGGDRSQEVPGTTDIRDLIEERY